jgi:hypothetical protein
MADNKASVLKKNADSENILKADPGMRKKATEDATSVRLPPLKQASKISAEANANAYSPKSIYSVENTTKASKWTAADKIREPDRLTSLISKSRDQDNPSSINPTNSPSRAGSSNLLSSLVARLSKAESALKASREKIKSQERTISTLQQEISDLKQAAKDNSVLEEETKATEFWQYKCESYLAQIQEMQAFLNRNGMIWKEEPLTNTLPVDFADLCKGIEILNLDLGIFRTYYIPSKYASNHGLREYPCYYKWKN